MASKTFSHSSAGGSAYGTNTKIPDSAPVPAITTDQNGVERTNGVITKCPANFPILGYKGLKKMPDGTLKCRDLVYHVGTIYCHDSDPKTCSNGFHFCEKLDNVYRHYSADTENHVFYQVEAWGKIATDKSDGKSSSQFLKLIRPVSPKQIFLSKVKPYLQKVDRILEANGNAIICGSLALILRGWIPYREIGDIDIILPYYQDFSQDDSRPEASQPVNSFGKSGTETIQMNANGIDFDLFIDPSETWSWMKIGDASYKVAHVKKLIEAKMRYYMQGAHKHGKDLENIFKQVEKYHEGDRNAFLKNGGLMKDIADRTEPASSHEGSIGGGMQYMEVEAKQGPHTEHDLEIGFLDDDLDF